jgi:hypothetical protein
MGYWEIKPSFGERFLEPFLWNLPLNIIQHHFCHVFSSGGTGFMIDPQTITKWVDHLGIIT